MILLFLKGLWGKVSFKLFLAIALALVCYFSAKAYVDAKVLEERNRWLNAPAKIEWKHDTIPAMPSVVLQPAKPIVIADTSLKLYADSLLASNASKDSIIRVWAQRFTDRRRWSTFASVRDTNINLKLGGWLNQGFSHRDGMDAQIDFDPIVLPVKEITKTVFEPYRANWFDVYTRAQVGGLWNRKFAHDLAASFEIGLRANIGKLHLSFAPGLASMQSKGYTYYVAGLEYVLTQD